MRASLPYIHCCTPFRTGWPEKGEPFTTISKQLETSKQLGIDRHFNNNKITKYVTTRTENEDTFHSKRTEHEVEWN